MGWVYLVFAGCFEMLFTTFLKLSNGFSKPVPITGFIIAAAASFWLLTLSLQTISLGTAYAVWTGIGAFGTALIGIYFFGDSIAPTRIFFLFLLIFSIVGLKFVD